MDIDRCASYKDFFSNRATLDIIQVQTLYSRKVSFPKNRNTRYDLNLDGQRGDCDPLDERIFPEWLCFDLVYDSLRNQYWNVPPLLRPDQNSIATVAVIARNNKKAL